MACHSFFKGFFLLEHQTSNLELSLLAGSPCYYPPLVDGVTIMVSLAEKKRPGDGYSPRARRACSSRQDPQSQQTQGDRHGITSHCYVITQFDTHSQLEPMFWMKSDDHRYLRLALRLRLGPGSRLVLCLWVSTTTTTATTTSATTTVTAKAGAGEVL